MKRSLVIAAAMLAASAAFAQEATPDTWKQAEVSKTRAQVQAELAQARQDGTIRSWSAGFIEPARSSMTRDEVVAALLQARASGELDRIDAEAASPGPAPMPATRVAASYR